MISNTLLPASAVLATSPVGIPALLESGQVPGLGQPMEELWQVIAKSPPPESPLVKALVQTFAQLGLTLPYSSGSTSGTSSDTNTAADINSDFKNFVGQIFQTLSIQQQGSDSSSALQNNPGGLKNGLSVAACFKTLAQALRSLAQGVGAAGSQSANVSGTRVADSTTSSNTAIASLEQEFNNLFGSSETGKGTSLQIFLQTLASNVAKEPTAGPGGVFVQTSA
ncbi:hypothetical protein [Paraburkholderia sp. HD33-4]|uniref:hypothetical protein n=1 Tax=Paraburkholderia sp. HD33-4 TaxID=2883242 RepID=UPI001F345787|nr:hypothetical protein [Paraburkholderia sp. HD33-4]